MLSNDFVKVFIYLEFTLKLFRIFVNGSDVGLPLIQIGHGKDNTDDSDTDFPDMLEQVHLTDFFWTGSGDGPPDFLKKIHTGISRGKDVVVKTETVVATIYVDGNNEIDIPLCLDCLDDAGHPIDNDWNLAVGAFTPLNFSATDRRYWLLTILSGFYTQQDNPILAAKLAKLYRLAFTRQQSKHLGINGDQHTLDNSLVINSRDRRYDLREAKIATTSNTWNAEVEVFDTSTNVMPSNKEFPQKHDFNLEWLSASEELPLENVSMEFTGDYLSDVEDIERTSTSVYPSVTSELWEFIQQPLKSGKQKELPKNALILIDDHVHVIIHNITQFTEKDLEQSIATNDDTFHTINSTNKIDERPIANQTELIYSVFVNGRPILATTAAKDMKLVSETEVSTIMGKQIYMKAEPYIREPQATPLAPAIHHSSTTLFPSFQNNPAMIIISFIILLLFLLLIGALLMMVRNHVCNNRLPGQSFRTSSRNELLCEAPSGAADSSVVALESGRTTIQSRDVGTQNISYDNDSDRTTREPRIHFPRPPASRSSRRRDSVTSSDNTSDSSVYCPITSTNVDVDVQRMLNEKADNLFERRKPRSRHQYDHAEGLEEEATYSRIISEKKRGEKTGQKSKRKYLSENRVGSLETSPVQSKKSEWSGGEQSKLMRQQRIYENYDGPKETFNTYNNYNRNKMLHQRTMFDDRIFLKSQHVTSAAAAQSKSIQSNNDDKSSDNSSIGSFLSMQSIRAFPKQELPQPLSRVLDPVSVTYYDNIENATKVGGKRSDIKSNEMLVEYFPTPKKPQKYKHFNSQSDNPDPGVLGPIVWERHKKRCGSDKILDNDGLMPSATYKSIRDPSTMRHHYEDLLEDAIQKYENQEENLPMPLPHNDCISTRQPLKFELRGSSAEKVHTPSKNLDYSNRPATAHACKAPKSNHSTQPPSPTFGAWNSGSACGSHSRPMSADPFNRPTDLYPNLISRPTVDLTSAPLIEAIQTELRKFQKHTK